MEILHIMPSTFLNTNIFFEWIFFIFAIAISYYAFKIYSLTDKRESKIFGWAFSFLAISHLALIVINSLFLSILNGGFRALEFENLIGIKNITISAYIFFLILGLITLFYTSLKIKSTRVYILAVILSMIILFFSLSKSMLIYLLASIFLLFITSYYFSEFIKTKNKNTLLVSIGFLMLLICNFLLALVADYSLSSAYVLAYVFEAIGYVLIILSLVKILYYGKKAK